MSIRILKISNKIIAGETAVITKREQRILFSEALLVSIAFKYYKKSIEPK